MWTLNGVNVATIHMAFNIQKKKKKTMAQKQQKSCISIQIRWYHGFSAQ